MDRRAETIVSSFVVCLLADVGSPPRMQKVFIVCVAAVIAVSACSKSPSDSSKASTAKPAAGEVNAAGPWSAKVEAGQELFATVETTMGALTVKLYSKDAPETVKNFVGLASGEKEWTNPATGEKKKGVPLYSGTIFHRVIDGFMIQGGDPLGNGTGDPGYRFKDEFQSGKTFNKPGLLAMANSGPNTNCSQFFITVATPNWLNNKHTIFGEVVKC